MKMISAGGEQRDRELESPRKLPDMAGADALPLEVRKNMPPVTPQSVRRGSIIDYFDKSVNSCTAGPTVNHETCHGSNEINEDDQAGIAGLVKLKQGGGSVM